jgi:peptidoglycan/LPS O-acetylase OafA/YrhL
MTERGTGAEARRVRPSDAPRGLATVLQDLAQGSADLVRQEVRLVHLEIGALVAAVGRGSVEVAAGGVLLLLGGLATIVGLVLLIGAQGLAGRYWLAAAIVGVASGAVAVVMGLRGLRLLSAIDLVPRQTVATLEEDAEWLTRQMRSGATSR